MHHADAVVWGPVYRAHRGRARVDVLHDGAAVDPVDRVDVHAVADEDALLDLLQERADDAQELVRAVVGFAALEARDVVVASRRGGARDGFVELRVAE